MTAPPLVRYKENLPNIDTTFFFIGILVVSWLPITGAIQVLTYILPSVFIIIGILAGKLEISVIDAVVLVGFGLFSFVFSSAHSDTGLLNAALGILTYSSLLILIVRVRSTNIRVDWLIVTIAVFSYLEFGIGLWQLIQSQGGLVFTNMAAGDVVVGTLGTNAQLYAAKMLLQSLLLLYSYIHVRREGVYCQGTYVFLIGASILSLIGAVIASALAFTLLFCASVWAFIGLRSGLQFVRGRGLPLDEILAVLFLTSLIVLVSLVVQRDNVRLIIGSADTFISNEEQGDSNDDFTYTLKYELLFENIQLVMFDKPANALIGLGLGRFSSRAAMILSGGYLQNQPEWMPISRSQETYERIYARWNSGTWHVYGGSVMGIPTSSLQAVIIEFGLIGTFVFAVFWFRQILILMQTQDRGMSKGQRYLARQMPVFLTVLMVVSTQDVWLEYPQFVSVIYIFMILGLSDLKTVTSCKDIDSC